MIGPLGEYYRPSVCRVSQPEGPPPPRQSERAPPGQAEFVICDHTIETLFGSCKARGFGLARTHLTKPEHLDRLILAIAIATCMTLGLGTHLVLSQQTARVDRADRRDLSLFQLGWRWLHRLLALDRLQEFKMVFSWRFTLPKPGFRPAT